MAGLFGQQEPSQYNPFGSKVPHFMRAKISVRSSSRFLGAGDRSLIE
jgi:hypothetical protein